jgi:GNAT superfamily N-acetyltransferase
MSIRKATLADIPTLAILFDQYRVWYGKPTDVQGAQQFLTARLSQEESVIFTAEAKGKIVGFTQLYPLFSSTRMKRLWLLNDLFVLEEERGKGYSKQLIAAAKDLCRDTNGCGLMLETQQSNDIGNQLYPATGFELNTEQNFYEWDVA